MTKVRSHVLYRTKTVQELTEREFEECKKATLIGGEGMYGMMQPVMIKMRNGHDNRPGWVTMMRNREGTLLGAALTFKHYDERFTSWFYVFPKYRRTGIGTQLHRIVRARFGVVETAPWDTRSRCFFEAIGAPMGGAHH